MPELEGDDVLVQETPKSVSVVLGGDASRQLAQAWVNDAPPGFVVTVEEAPAQPNQKNLFFAICSALARSPVLWDGQRQSKTDWYDLLLHAYAITKGWKPQLVPGLEGERLVLGRWSIRNLSKSQVSELIDYAKEWAASKGVEVRDE